MHRMRTTPVALVLAAAAVTAGIGTAGSAAAATVSGKPTALKIAAAGTVSSKTTFHERVTGALTAAKVPLVGRIVELEDRPNTHAAWTHAQHAVTAPKTGAVAFEILQSSPVEEYRLVFAGGRGYASSTSAAVTVRRA